MISYSKYKLFKEVENPVAAPGTSPPTPGSPSSPSTPDLGSLGAPPGFSGGPPMPGIGGGGPSFDAGLGGPPMGGGGPTDLKPVGLKSSNVWDVLEKILDGSSKQTRN